MRVISGSAKGKKLKMVSGEGTRPITDRAKESLFNILGQWIVRARVLDLFGGTGAVGIEALSRGAAHVTFIDNNRRAIKTIGDNLRLTGLAEHATVYRRDSFKFLINPPDELAAYDLVYIAPPQYQSLWIKAIQLIDRQPEQWLLPDGAVVVQIHPNEYEAVSLTQLVLYDQRKYGSTLLCFYDRGAADETDE